jgi:hypothetical protein
MSDRNRDVHVCNVVGADKYWFVIYKGEIVSATVFKKQSDAIRLGKQVAKIKRTELCIRGKNGQIRRKISYGNDPRSSKG